MSLILLCFARSQCSAATHLSSPEVGNGLSWPKPQCTCNAMVTGQAQHNTNEGVLRGNSACSLLMSDDLQLPRRGIKPRPSGFRGLDSTVRPLPLPSISYSTNSISITHCHRMHRIRTLSDSQKDNCCLHYLQPRHQVPSRLDWYYFHPRVYNVRSIAIYDRSVFSHISNCFLYSATCTSRSGANL